MTTDEIKERLAEWNPDALLADGFDAALIGMARRTGAHTLAVYDYELGIRVLMMRDGMTRDEAISHMEAEVLGSSLGKHTPLWLDRCCDYYEPSEDGQ